jgi:FMN phosphatase YigB (HAD superfamily)
MACELAKLAVSHPFRAPTTWRVIAAYRASQEILRNRDDMADASAQLALTAERTGIALHTIAAIVDEWIFDRPLRHLGACRVSGVVDLLALLDRRRVRTGILSDYPAERKLAALGLADRFSLVLCGGDRDIAAFKPNPRGHIVACARWGLSPAEVLYVGDRADVDAVGAAAAGMPAVIVTASRMSESADVLAVPSFERLCDVLNDDHSR